MAISVSLTEEKVEDKNDCCEQLDVEYQHYHNVPPIKIFVHEITQREEPIANQKDNSGESYKNKSTSRREAATKVVILSGFI